MAAPKVKKPTQARKDFLPDLKETAKGLEVIIPHEAGTAILLDKASVDELEEELEISRDVIAGMNDIIEGRVHSRSDIRKFLASKAKKWKSK